MRSRINLLLLLLILVVAAASCTTAPPQVPVTLPVPPAPGRSTVKHVVGPGETLWRISKIYDVPVASIMDANHLESRTLAMGTTLRIPRAKEAEQQITLYPSKKWRYIIIHHSGTDEGNSLSFNKYHLSKGWENGVGYHFVIDNGESGRPSGFVEITPRWLKQEDGAHCKASDMNVKAIGICLVGNYNRDHLPYAQRKTLEDLVKKLRAYYHIPLKNILRHGEVRDAQTDCPGKKFPWDKFKKDL